MARKVFISFLGTNNYQPTRYYAEDDLSDATIPLRFVQEASLIKHCCHFKTDDEVLIFTTLDSSTKELGAKTMNWFDYHHYDFAKKEPGPLMEGLMSRLNKLNLHSFKQVDIPNGKSTTEIWEIFSIVFNCIQDSDTLYFDITHSFRSIPMLNMLLISYSKLLKDVTIAGIYYGAFEASKVVGGEKYTPIWDLKAFSELQDWTAAAQMFLLAGYPDQLSVLMGEKLKESGELVNDFTKQILSNRCLDIFKGTSPVSLHENIQIIKNDNCHPALKPILEKIELRLVGYKNNNVLNGFLAVEWCIERNLIQQGYTILSELLPSYVLSKLGFDFKIKFNRDAINGFMAINGNLNKFKFSEIESEKASQERMLIRATQMPYFKQLCERNRSINASNRDDINHGGFRLNPKTYEVLKAQLSDKYEKLRDVILKCENV